MPGTEKVGARVYVTGNSYPIRDRLKRAGCRWDPDRRQWWIGSSKAKELEQIVKCSVPADSSEKKTEDPDTIRLVGKARYKGKTFYCRWVGHTRKGDYMAHLCSLDGKLDFWALCAQPHETQHDGLGEIAVITKMYQAREYRGRAEYTTLGSIQRFVERERKNREEGGEVCAECGRSGELIEDLEDGLRKHRHCCDMPSE
jgi:hypothetical protein